MHEFSVADSLLDLAIREMSSAGGRRITKVRIRVGQLSGVEPELLRFAFQHLRDERPETRGAELEMELVPPEARCLNCGHIFGPQELPFLCPNCGSHRCQLLRGEELLLLSMEMELGDEN